MGSALLSTFPQPSGTKGEKTIATTQHFYTKFQIKLSQTIDTFRFWQPRRWNPLRHTKHPLLYFRPLLAIMEKGNEGMRMVSIQK